MVMVMSLLIRYAHIPFYFRFSFAFSTLPIHHYAPPLQRDRARACMTIALALSDWSHLLDGHMTYNSHVFTSILSVSNMPPPAVWPITSSRTARSGTFYSFAICSHSCYHSYLTCLYLPFTREHHCWSPNQLPIWVSPRIEILHLRFTLISHYFALFRIASHSHDPTVSTCHNTPGDNPLPPDRTPSEPHRIYT